MKKKRDVGVTRYIVTNEFIGDRERLQRASPIKLFDIDVVYSYDWTNKRVHVETLKNYESVHDDIDFVVNTLLNNDSVIEWMHRDQDHLGSKDGWLDD